MPHPNFLTAGAMTGLIESQKFDDLIARQWFGGVQSDGDTFDFEVLYGTGKKANFRGNDAGAGTVARMARKIKTVKLANIREKKLIKEATIRLMNAPGKREKESGKNALARELADLKKIADRTWEYCMWEMMTDGTIDILIDGVTYSYDFGMAAGNQETLLTTAKWSAAATCTPLDDIRGWKQTVQQLTGETVTEIVMSSTALGYLVASTQGAGFLSDSAKDEYRETGTLKKLSDCSVAVVDHGYLNSSGTFTRFLGEYTVILKTGGEIGQFCDGPAIDSQAPEGHIGIFSKSYVQEDPPGRWALMHWKGFPGLTKPDNLFVATVHS